MNKKSDISNTAVKKKNNRNCMKYNAFGVTAFSREGFWMRRYSRERISSFMDIERMWSDLHPDRILSKKGMNQTRDIANMAVNKRKIPTMKE
ncbi:hypothetical protein NPIL_224341 [Nephila pilipes]|uniref:Uncharacterized protein n=1 Tax=Nephila pilipes TaxID=299642 RepID=A0A8X6KIV4_NEPPI|nr:hypothetical protein NPIL_224341 [Nephila pilipes]